MTKLFTITDPPPSPSTGADVALGRPILAGEIDQNFVNLRAAIAAVEIPTIDVRHYMDGKDGRPALAVWQADPSGTDVTSSIQAALDVMPQVPLTFPAGVFCFTKINIHSQNQIIGAGQRLTELRVLPSSEPWAVTMDRGPVVGVEIRDLQLTGGANAGQGGFYFYAQAPLSGYDQGGLWWSNLENLWITGFSGHSIWLRGGATGYQHPNQFNNFRNVYVFRASGTANRAVLATGQNGQTVFDHCQLDGVSKGDGLNVEVSREFTNGAVTGGASVGGTANGDNAPGINFMLVTSQNADMAISVDRGTANIERCTFENLQHAISISTSSTASRVLNNTFSNAGSDGSGGGYCISVGSSSSAKVHGNRYTGSFDKFLVGVSDLGVPQSENHGDSAADGLTSGITSQVTASAGVITLSYRQSVYLNTPSEPITTINSNLTFGDDITIQCQGATTFAGGGNIILQAGRPLKVDAGGVVVFTRTDIITGWIPKSVTQSHPTSLTVDGSTSGTPGTIMLTDEGTFNPRIKMFKWTGSGSNYYQSTIAASVNSSGSIDFQTGGVSGAEIGSDTQTTVMTLTRTGRLLLGNRTDDLATTLQVNGSMSATTVAVSGTITAAGLSGGAITDSTNTTSSTKAASATAVKAAYDLANSKPGITNSYPSTSETTAATPAYVKAAFDNYLVGLPVYADNIAAIAGGLAVGQPYRTDTGHLMVRY